MTITTKLNGQTVKQFNTKETAAAIRTALKVAFTGVKFSVRFDLYSMGSSTYVKWNDGPTEPEVEAITDQFTSQTFDGMTDSTSYHTQEVNGEVVQYSGYVQTRREISDGLRAMAERRAEFLGTDNVWPILRTMRPNGFRVTLKGAR